MSNLTKVTVYFNTIEYIARVEGLVSGVTRQLYASTCIIWS